MGLSSIFTDRDRTGCSSPDILFQITLYDKPGPDTITSFHFAGSVVNNIYTPGWDERTGEKR
jgi:hypothetical protein